jgi:lipopolysaccharide biosynthesis regulator YciM
MGPRALNVFVAVSQKLNSKPVINTLTELANGYSKEHPNVIVHLVEERIKEVARPRCHQCDLRAV